MIDVIHVVISLEPGGLERIVVDMTNARNREMPGSTKICCLDGLGALAGEVDGGEMGRGMPLARAVITALEHTEGTEWERTLRQAQDLRCASRADAELAEQASSGRVAQGGEKKGKTIDPSSSDYAVASHRPETPLRSESFRLRPVGLRRDADEGQAIDRGEGEYLTTDDTDSTDGGISTSNAQPRRAWQASNLSRPGGTSNVQGGARAVFCVNADRSKFPWDRAAVRRLRAAITHSLGECEQKVTKETKYEIDGNTATNNQQPQHTLLHAHNMAAWQYAVLAARGTGARVVVTHHGSNIYTKGLLNGLRIKWLSQRTDAVVAVSESVRRELSATWGFAGTDMAVVPNGVKARVEHGARSKELISGLKHGLGVQEASKVIGSIGRMSREKGYDRLLQAFSGFRFQVSGLYLLLIGEGAERASLERQAENLGVRDRIVFAGYRSDARELLSVMDLFVLPSRSEGLPVALLEAMAAGVPVAATDAGECRAVLNNGEFGGLLSEDEAGWAEFLSSLLSSGSVPERLQKAQEHVEKKYSFDTMLNGYERIYNELLAGEPSNRSMV